jgi:hypothetical protein
VGIRSERVEAPEGAVGHTTWTPVVGLADETSERGRLCGISLVRSSRRQPSTTACPGGDGPPQAGEEPAHLPFFPPSALLLSCLFLGTLVDGEVT